jgi:hypothetical protein
MKNNFTTGQPTRRSKEQRQVLIEQWRQSGTSKKAFCREQKLNYLTFISWGGKRSSLSAGRAGITGFAPLQMPKETPYPNAGSFFAEVTYSNGNTITLHESVPVQYLRSLVK